MADTKAVSLRQMFAELRRTFRDAFSSYRPERHYMRGPGPKWRERHARAAAPDGYPAGAIRIAS
jgi:hypothetical protein